MPLITMLKCSGLVILTDGSPHALGALSGIANSRAKATRNEVSTGVGAGLHSPTQVDRFCHAHRAHDATAICLMGKVWVG